MLATLLMKTLWKDAKSKERNYVIMIEKVNPSHPDKIADRIAPGIRVWIQIVPQDIHLADNQNGKTRCGDNGIFKGVPLTDEQKALSPIERDIYTQYPTDGGADNFLDQR